MEYKVPFQEPGDNSWRNVLKTGLPLKDNTYAYKTEQKNTTDQRVLQCTSKVTLQSNRIYKAWTTPQTDYMEYWISEWKMHLENRPLKI